MVVKATFHFEGGDYTMTFEGHKTFRKINHSRYRTLLLVESKDDMNQEFKDWLDYTLHHGGGSSVPRIKVTISSYDDAGNVLECFRCTDVSPRRWFTRRDMLREIELDYITKTKIKDNE